MAQATIRLTTPEARQRAAQWCYGAEDGTAVNFVSPDKRTLEQNALLWARLTEIAAQVIWDGQLLPADDWKLLFLADMSRGARMVRALDGRGYVNLNTSSSSLRVREFAELLDAVQKFAEEQGVISSLSA